MIGGLKNTTSRLALVAAAGFVMGGMALTPVKAADLGGDCCADLEERVAELEATTVRKGNRKVSLTISGHVNRVFGILWDDGAYHNGAEKSELYSAGSGISGSRVQFAGSAELVPGWTAGYTIRFRLNQDRSSAMLYAGDANPAAGLGTPGIVYHDRNFVYLKNDRLGTFVAGQAGAPTDGISNISLGGHGVTGDAEGDNGWNGIVGYKGFDLENDGQGYQALAYISPTLYGFTFAAAWADIDGITAAGAANYDVDVWDLALRYAQEFGPLRVAAGIGYTVDDAGAFGSNLMGSVALMHTPTGLNVEFAAGTEIDGGLAQANNGQDAQFWYVAAGINRDFTGLGNTSFYGEYGSYDYDGDNAMVINTASSNTDKVTMWGLGVVQHFDKAATELYLAYRHWDAEDAAGANPVVGNGLAAGGAACAATGCLTDGDVDQVLAGMRIKF